MLRHPAEVALEARQADVGGDGLRHALGEDAEDARACPHCIYCIILLGIILLYYIIF